jgi:gas vesicle protein GvpN
MVWSGAFRTPDRRETTAARTGAASREQGPRAKAAARDTASGAAEARERQAGRGTGRATGRGALAAGPEAAVQGIEEALILARGKVSIPMVETMSKDLAAVMVRVQPEGDDVLPEASDEFVATPHIRALAERALAYLGVGYAVHFAGAAGTGKTTLAFHVAAKLGRPVTLIHGDDEFGSSDLIGKDAGYRKSKLIDNYIHSVLKTEENMNTLWVDNRLTTACANGNTLIYDEFNRSRPEANNALLSVLEEKILNLPALRPSGAGYLEVHPDFRAIFTSNPEEYAGVHKTQDALMDRLITLNLGNFDRETEIQIGMAKSGLPRADAEVIVDIVRELRGTGVNNHRPTIRATIVIARILAHRRSHARLEDPVFQWVCHDVLTTETAKVTRDGQSLMADKIDESMARICGASLKPRRSNGRPAPADHGKD